MGGSPPRAVSSPSRRVLQCNGFEVVGTRVDPEDGAVLCWERRV